MKVLSVLVLILVIITAGCASILPVQAGNQKPLELNKGASFENNGYSFTATIDDIGIKDPARIVLTLSIENTGQKGITLSAMPTMKDPAGTTYIGQTLFFSQIAPGYRSTQKGVIGIPGRNISGIGPGSSLDIRFQGVSPLPYGAVWAVNLAGLSP